MSASQSKRRYPNKENKIFISWSKQNSKEFAKVLKQVLEKQVFDGYGLECFVSDVDIASGEDWWARVRKELKSCKMGILCITKENISAPWIYFEAGAMVAQSVSTIPLLINCDFRSLASTPLKNQSTDFYDQAKFIQMLVNIKDKMGYDSLTNDHIKTVGLKAYENMKDQLSTVLQKLHDMRAFNTKYVYPNTVDAVRRNTIYVSAPMSSIPPEEYHEIRNFVIQLKQTLLDIGFSEVYCPVIDKEDPAAFDGQASAVKDNFPLLKQADSLLLIYPHKIPSSVLVESGYGIALTKRMVIFYNSKEGLPFMLEGTNTYIPNIKILQFESFTEIEQIVRSNRMVLFESANGVIDEVDG